ncbi:glycosyltransferase [uncultured Tenacibaculum sp.]|uniref:glycosyltransferase n=1 Tax=uncultured Tenacibaculum sp. TaxID=174713 RepID=UPI00261B6527|nr:glycosyltransferase [uncultured Tenacibaculum sp.]
MNNKICFILNYAPHYRYFIFKKINDELDAHFYFGNIPNSSIKKINYKELSNFRKELITFKVKKFYWYLGSVLLVFKKYDKFVLSGDSQILSNWFILLFSRLLGKKTYLWTHGWYGNENTVKKNIKKAYYKLSDGLLLYGNYAQDLMVIEGFKKDNLHVVYNSLDYDKQLSIRKKSVFSDVYINHFKNSNPTIIFTGRLTKVKKLNQLIDAKKKLDNLGIKVNLVFVGSGPEQKKLRSQVKFLKLENCWFYGACYDEIKLGELMYNSAICVSPGNVGLTAIHSLMFGVPVVTHNNFSQQMPEFEVVIEGKTGAFFKEDDVNDLALKIKLLIEGRLAKEECYKTIDEKWNPHNQINILKEVLNESAN